MADLAPLECFGRLTGTGYPALGCLAQLSADGEGVYEEGVYEEGVYESVAEGTFNPETVGFEVTLENSPMDFLNPTAGQQFCGPIHFSPNAPAGATWESVDPLVKAWTGWYTEDEHGQRFGWTEPMYVAGGPPRLHGGRADDDESIYNSGRKPTLHRTHAPLDASFGNPYGRAQWFISTVLMPGIRAEWPLSFGSQPATAARREVRLLSYGVAENAGDDRGLPDERVFTGIGPLLSYADRLVTLQLPRGHGWTRQKIVATILGRLGISASRIAVGGTERLYGAIEIIQRNALQAIAQILYPELLELYTDEQGTFRTRPVTMEQFNQDGSTAALPVSVTFTSRHILRGSVKEIATTQGPTRVKLRGTKQVLRDDDGTITEDLPPTVTEEIYTPREAAFTQNSSTGALTPFSAVQTAQLRVVRRVEKSVTRRGDTVLVERTRTYGWFSPITWRYQLAADGTFAGYNGTGYIYDSDAIAGDARHMYAWAAERFVLISDIVTRHVYDDNGYLVRIETLVDAPLLPRVPIKARTLLGDPWDGEDFQTTGTLYLGNFEAVSTAWAIERMTLANSGYGQPYSRKSVDYTIREAENDAGVKSGNRTRDVETVEGWTRRAGYKYLYGGSVLGSDDSSDVFVVLQVDTTDYVAQKEGWHWQRTETRDQDGHIVRSTEDPVSGYLPPAERSEELTPDSATFPDGKPASRYEQQDIHAEVNATFLEAYRDRQDLDEEVPYVETTEGLQRLCWHKIRQGCAIQVNWTGPLCPWLHRGKRVVLSAPDYTHDLILRRVSHPAGDTALTQFVGEKYLL